MIDLNYMTLLEKKSQPAVKAHIDMLQGVISRMAKNSANCKSWAIPLITAILLLALEKEVVSAYTAIFPLCVFYLLDCYYLGLERKFKDHQRNFIIKLNKGEDISKYIYLSHNSDEKCWFLRRLCSFRDQLVCTLDGMFSFSTTIVYGLLALSIHLISKI